MFLSSMATFTTTTTTTSLSPISTPSSSSLSAATSAVKLPSFTGLKSLTSRPSTRIALFKSAISRSEFAPSVARVVCESSDTTVQTATVNEQTWKSLVLESSLPVLVEFWAPWCGPCRMIKPLIDELSMEFAGKLKVFQVNTDESPTIASDYGVRSIPTVIIFKNGKKKETIIGAVPKPTLTDSIEKFL